MSQPVTEYIRYRIEPSAHEAFEAAYRRAQASLRQSPHCLGYALGRCVEEESAYILRIEWDSMSGHLEGFRKGPHFAAFLAEIRGYINNIEEMRHYRTTDVAARPSIYEAVGGAGTFFRLARAMHEAMQEDDLLGSWFRNAAPTHVPHLAMWLCEVFGGPPLWTDTLDDLTPMLERHRNLDIPEDKRARFAQIATRAVGECLPKNCDDAAAAICAYFEWGTTIAVDNSKPDHVPNPSAGVPTWGWD